MISTSSHWNNNQEEQNNNPFLLKPVGKDYLWGGQRLNSDFAKNIDMNPLAETWECSTHEDGLSIVASGEYSGLTLKRVLEMHPEYVGLHPKTKSDIPILIKLIDAKQDLSVQVHPDDDYAFANENGQLGKSEMWYVLDATPDARLVYGLHHSISKEDFLDSLMNGKAEIHLQKTPVKANDVFFIKAGTIHAIGKGALIAEIQEKSNLTYRLYDYNRVDKNGNKRELHIQKGLDVARLDASAEPDQPMRVLRYEPGCARELLCRCKYFQVERLLVNTDRHKEMVTYYADDISFRVLLCVNGCGTIFWGNHSLSFFKGDCIFVPAQSVRFKIHGKAQFLSVSC